MWRDNWLERNDLRVWLGGRDSNPDNLLQRQMSYRWTTSQCQSRRGEGQELLIIAVPKLDRQAPRLTLGRRVLVVAESGQIVDAHHLLRIRGVLHRRSFILWLMLLFPPIARHAALAARLACFLAGPLVRRALLVSCLSAFARDIPLFAPIHRRKTTSFLGHLLLLALRARAGISSCNRCASGSCKYLRQKHLGIRLYLSVLFLTRSKVDERKCSSARAVWSGSYRGAEQARG